MSVVRALSLSLLTAIPALALAAPALPQAMKGAGLWEVSRSASGAAAQRLCVADPALLAQWEHRTAACTRVVISAGSDRAEIHYTCPGGGFGRSKVQVLTPRTLRIDTQGISGGYPFAYVLHARRAGPCPRR